MNNSENRTACQPIKPMYNKETEWIKWTQSWISIHQQTVKQTNKIIKQVVTCSQIVMRQTEGMQIGESKL